MNKLTELLETMKEHQKQDRLVQGGWISNEIADGYYKGCFFGCAMQTSDGAIEKACEKYDLPLWIGYWSEAVFEGLEAKDAVKWPVQLLESLINFSGDTEKLRHDLAIKRLTNLLPTENKKVNSAVKLVIDYHKNPDETTRVAASSAAWSATRSAARSTPWSAAWSAGWSATSSVAWPAGWSATSSVAWPARSVAESAAWYNERDWMLELLK